MRHQPGAPERRIARERAAPQRPRARCPRVLGEGRIARHERRGHLESERRRVLGLDERADRAPRPRRPSGRRARRTRRAPTATGSAASEPRSPPTRGVARSRRSGSGRPGRAAGRPWSACAESASVATPAPGPVRLEDPHARRRRQRRARRRGAARRTPTDVRAEALPRAPLLGLRDEHRERRRPTPPRRPAPRR